MIFDHYFNTFQFNIFTDIHHLLPAGSYNPDTQSTSDAACRACPAGYYCPDTGMSKGDNADCELNWLYNLVLVNT